MASRAMMGKTQRVVYSAAKAALVGMTRSTCLEVAADGIIMNVIEPGPVGSQLFDNGHLIGSAKRQKVIDGFPVKRVGAPNDIARMVAFLLAAENGYITGQTIFVCGGASISGAAPAVTE